MDLAKRLLESIFSPVGIIVLLFVSGLLLSVRKSKLRLGPRCLFLGASLFLIFTFSPLAEILISGLEQQYPPLVKLDPTDQIKSVVILSAYGEEHPIFPITSNISEQTMCRISEGIRIHQQLPDSKIILSGGVVRKGDRPIADTMADYVKAMGIPDSALVIEGQSRNTHENLIEVRKIVGTDPFILVTSAFGLRRAMAVAHKLEMNPVPAPACIWAAQRFRKEMSQMDWWLKVLGSFVHPSTERLRYLQWAYHEHLGYLWYKLLGRI